MAPQQPQPQPSPEAGTPGASAAPGAPRRARLQRPPVAAARSPAPSSRPSPAGFPAEEQRIIFNGKQLEDELVLSAVGVEEEATLNVLGRLLGGAKKRKKKTYTKPKKQKHKHKKIKLRVLKFYKVRPAACCWPCALPLAAALQPGDRPAPRAALRSPPARLAPRPAHLTTSPPRRHHPQQVEDSGKVQRLRKQCPNCGPGIFMATHFDRVYCGKCASTFLYEKEAAAGKKSKK
jgi:ribosomal protein S27AE